MKFAILLFDDVDLLDAGGPYEVFLTASRLARRDGAAASFDVVTVSVDGRPVTAYGGLGLSPEASPTSRRSWARCSASSIAASLPTSSARPAFRASAHRRAR